VFLRTKYGMPDAAEIANLKLNYLQQLRSFDVVANNRPLFRIQITVISVTRRGGAIVTGACAKLIRE